MKKKKFLKIFGLQVTWNIKFRMIPSFFFKQEINKNIKGTLIQLQIDMNSCVTEGQKSKLLILRWFFNNYIQNMDWKFLIIYLKELKN